MANIIWPPELPQRPLLNPWQAQQPSARWSFEGDEGPAMTRPKGARGRKMSMEFLMTRKQWATFRTFWQQSLNNARCRSTTWTRTVKNCWKCVLIPLLKRISRSKRRGHSGAA